MTTIYEINSKEELINEIKKIEPSKRKKIFNTQYENEIFIISLGRKKHSYNFKNYKNKKELDKDIKEAIAILNKKMFHQLSLFTSY